MVIIEPRTEAPWSPGDTSGLHHWNILKPSAKTLEQLGTRPLESPGCPLHQLWRTAALAELLQPVLEAHIGRGPRDIHQDVKEHFTTTQKGTPVNYRFITIHPVLQDSAFFLGTWPRKPIDKRRLYS